MVYRIFPAGTMVARGRFELPSMGFFLVKESKAHHWPGHCFRPLLVHYTTGLQETRVPGPIPISLLRESSHSFTSTFTLEVFRSEERRVGNEWRSRGAGAS